MPLAIYAQNDEYDPDLPGKSGQVLEFSRVTTQTWRDCQRRMS